MNKQTRFTIALVLSVVALALLSIAPVRSTSAARSQNITAEARRLVNVLPGVSLADGQTLHVTLVNVGSNPFEIVPCVFDGDGAHLKTGGTVRLAPGHMSSFEMSRAEAGRRTESRVEVRAGVHINDEDVKSLLVSGEVIEDATGRSSLFLPGETSADPIQAAEKTPPDEIRPGQETPFPILPAVGITYGQHLHATFLNVGPNPLEIVPCVFNDEGEHIKTGDRLTLQPGQMLSLDMDRSEVGGTGNRLQMRVAVHGATNDLKYLRVSGEVIEDATSRATLFIPGLVDPPEPIKQ